MAQHRFTTQGLSVINSMPARIEGPSLLHELVAPPSAATAIDFLEYGSKRRILSYETLHIMSDILAQKIVQVLARLEDASAIIPVLLPQSPELYIALLAILKAGKAFCPLGLDTPLERLNFILKDISADILITDVAHGKDLDLPSNIITLKVEDELSHTQQPIKGTPSLSRPNNLAYVLYTSGSTGTPKAVSVSHRAVTQSLLAHDRHIPSFSRFLQFAAPTFDVSIFEIFFPWYRGRTLVGCTRAHMLGGLPETIRNLEVDAAELTPTVVSNLLTGRSSVPSLKLLLTIGEMLTQDVISEYGNSDEREGILWAMYGPTEASIHCTLQARLSATASVGAIGAPLDTVSAFIATPSQQGSSPSTFTLLPLGEEGELVVGGPQIAEEYLNRPELTSASFIHHPDYGYLYRTGDRARLRSDGTLECSGRITTGQVKLKGQRVELGEIEQVIMKASICRAVVVHVVDEQLVAFCATGLQQVSREDVERVCKRWLPEIMVPSQVVISHSMPQLSSGKIDKAALIAEHRRTVRCNGSNLADSDEVTDHPIFDILKRHLGQDLNMDTELAAVGFDSLQAIRLASALRRQGYNLATIRILSATTVGGIVAAAEDSRITNAGQHIDSMSFAEYHMEDNPELERWREKVAHTLPCTPLQEAMLAETIARPTAYCNWFEVEIDGSHTFADIWTALDNLARRNEILRSGFYPMTSGNGTFLQVVWKELEASQTREVQDFSKTYALETSESLLRPLSIQARVTAGRTRLVFQAHHALYDGWSLDLIIQDLESILRKEDPPQRPQFREVVRYHAQSEHTKEADRQYWSDSLRNRRDLSLPNFNGEIVEGPVSRSIAGRSTVRPHALIERCRELQINPQVFFQAATAFVTSLYLGSTDVIIGNVTSGRTIPVAGVENIIGPCIASLPCRLHFDRLLQVRDVLNETQRLNRESLEHIFLPLREITKAAKLPAGARLFDVLFVWQQSLYSNPDAATSVRLIESADDLEFKMTLEYEPHPDHISFRATFDPTTIPESQAQNFLRQIDEVVHMFLDHPDYQTSEVPQCFTAASRSIANAIPQQQPMVHGPAHAVEKWAQATPDKEAIIFARNEDGSMRVTATVTYSELNRRANQFARVLQKRGVRPGDLLGVIMEKSVELYISILAVLKAGAGYLPLVPDLPDERMKAILSNAEVTVCISDLAASARVRQCTSAAVLCMDQIDLSGYPEHNVGAVYDGSNIAYAVFTSGSTGTPKGVLVTQDNLMSNLDYLAQVYPYSASSRLLQACSQAFDVSVFEIFFSWHVGICLCTATKDDLFADLERAITAMKITHLSLTPTVAALIDPDNVPYVRFLVTAGEAVTEHVRRQWAGRGLYQGYGPSETTNICTLRTSVSSTDLINNIGRPFDNTSAFVLDPQSTTILPRGAVGELCFGGFQVFHGYLNQPKLTAAKILDHPQYGRIYRSGDLGVMLHDDSLLFVGRIDDQVKIRGQRVELGEITSAILDQEVVLDCATLLVGSLETTRLVAFWVPGKSFDTVFSVLDPRALRSTTLDVFASISHRLPPYMVPSHLVPVSRLPMTAQGKIDKRLLQSSLESLSDQALETAAHASDASGEAAITDPWEARVVQVLAEILAISTQIINRTTSFFNLGLDSVSAIRFSNGLRKAGLGEFPISTILKNSDILHLSGSKNTRHTWKHLTNGNAQSPEHAINESERHRLQRLMSDRGTQVKTILPCTPLQEAMISSAQTSSETLYNNVMVFSVNSDLRRLQQCWFTMVKRHDILRTAFVPTKDTSHAFAQVVTEGASIAWAELPWSTEVHTLANRKILELLHAYRPPVWLAVARTAHATKLVFCCHHAIYDGVAIQVLLRELQDAYHDRELLPSVPYNAYLQHMLSQDLGEADKFWRSFFQGFEPTMFPDLTGKSHKTAPLSASHSRRLKSSLSEVREACQSASVSLLSVVHATWAKLLHFYTGETDICLGNVVSGRTLSGHDLQRLIAPCFNTLPVRVNIDLSKDNNTLMKLVHDVNVNSLTYQLTPLRRIQNATLTDGSRLFDTLVILQQPAAALDASIWTLEEDRGEMDLPLVCEISQDEEHDKLELVIHYHSTILSATEAAIVAETFDAGLAHLVAHPEASVSDTNGIPSHLRAESNFNFSTIESCGQLLQSGFERNARENPDRIALDFLHVGEARTAWSFAQLNEKANDIAIALIDAGVKVEDIVPIHISKDPLFYASVLGVLKAGAAFAPVHPDLPEFRKRLMLEELDANIILVANGCPLPNGITRASSLDVAALSWAGTDNPVVRGLADTNLAYCLFTSGSTGIPKAVSVEHRAPMHTIESSRSLVPWTSDSRLLQYAATTFDMCYYDCFLAWTFGFTLCTAEQHLLLDELPRVINTLQVDLLDLTPSIAGSISREEVPTVKWLYCIGEAMSPNIVNKWEGACVNSYGPTESAFCTTIYPVSKGIKANVIGRPFSSTSFAVFSTNSGYPSPILSIGELYIGGAQLARGYLGKSELTDEKFIKKYGQRFYRSGDLVRMLADGNFEFIGRADDQVKIRGLRVELDEINNVLQHSCTNVKAVVTLILKKDPSAREQLVAFVVESAQHDRDHQADTRKQLGKIARDRLPSYMIPQFFIFVDRIPLSLAGKVDKNALRELFRNAMDKEETCNGSGEKNHSWTETETCIRGIFAQLSNSPSEDVSPTTTIYQLGLDSISAVQIATALREQGYDVHAADVMRYLTCVDIAAHLGRGGTRTRSADNNFDFRSFDAKHNAYVLETCGAVSEEVTAIRPCTPLQKGMISQMMAQDGTVYVNHLRMEIDPGVDVRKLEQAWHTAMLSHQMLRTGFVELKDKETPFGMVEYSPDTTVLPWTTSSEDDTPTTLSTWRDSLQRQATNELHRPPWGLRLVHGTSKNYLDLVIFHALFDAQSLQSIFHTVIAAYKDLELPPQAPIDPLIDLILHRSSDLDGQAKNFWKRIGEHVGPCRFPNLAPLRLRSSPPIVHVHRSCKSLADLEQACRKANTTIQSVGIASWLSLLSAYTGESAVTCGVVLSGRDFEAAEKAVFPCINTVPIAQNVTPDSSNMLKSITSTVAELQQYQCIPLNEVQRIMGFPTEALFDTIFAYQKMPMADDEDHLWTVVDENASIEYPVSIELDPRQNHLEYRLTFMPHVIPREQAALMLEQFDHIVQSFLLEETGHDSTNTSLYSITPAKEPTLQSEARLLHDFVEITAQQCPQRVALEFANSIDGDKYSADRWTYSQLDAKGNKVANLLIANGVGPGELVGVCFDKCPEASFAILGILKAGCAFVAIDPGAPAARQTFIVRDSKAAAVLSMMTQSKAFINDIDVPCLNLDVVDTTSLQSCKPTLARAVTPQDRSYCLYTSGTTGTPKGCELTHENAVQALLSFQRLFAGHWTEQSRWLQFASFHFDVSVLEQFWSWSVGICVVSTPRDVIFEDLANSIRTLRITHIDLTPSLAQTLHPDEVPSLCEGVFITGGESLKQEILDAWGPKGVIYNGYGPTEATIGCTMYPRVPANGKPSNIGRQFENVGTYVLKPGSDEPVLRGGVGELCVAGTLVGKGYLNRDDLTEKSFPYLGRFGERVYRTGDLVRILHDNTFEFLGRADDQIKLRGQRLEIGEINSVIRQSSKHISDVATLVLKHPRQQKEQLVTFVVQGKTKGDAGISLDKVSELVVAREACHERLPPYMVPTHFVPLSSLPLNVNNKADGKKLKALYEILSASDLQKLSMTPDGLDQQWSVQELKLRNLIAKELDVTVDALGRDTNFFELGMDSISVIGVTRLLKQAALRGATASLIMRHSTLRRLAKALSSEASSTNDRASLLAAQQAIAAIQHRHRRTVARSLLVDVAGIEAVAPCAPLQQGMIARSLDSENGLYFNRFVFELSTDVDHRRLQEAWHSVYASTQILRTLFVGTEDGYVQASSYKATLPWEVDRTVKQESVHDSLSRLKRRWLERNQGEFVRPFELVAFSTPERQLLVVHIFHGLYDGISIELIFSAVWDAYNDNPRSDGAPSFFSALAHGPLRVQEGAEDFWRGHLSLSAAKPLPSQTKTQNSKPTQVTRELKTLDAFESTRRRLNVTPQAIVQACWLSILQELTKGETTMGMVVSGRSIDLEGADHVIGPMFNTIPYRHQPQQRDSWVSFIKRVHDFNIAAHPYQHTPLRDIAKWSKTDPARPLFDNLFVFQMGQANDQWANNSVWKVLDGEAIADYPLAIEIEQTAAGTLRLTLVTQGHVVDEIASNELLNKFESALRQAIDEPEKLLGMSPDTDDAASHEADVNKPVANGHNGTSQFEWTDDAKQLRKLLADLTNSELDNISDTTSIFELGLDSIDAIQISSRLKKSGMNLPVSKIMRGLTIANMLPDIRRTEDVKREIASSDASYVKLKRSLRDHCVSQNMDMSEIEDILPPTPLQEAMVADMMTSEFTRYYNFDVMELDASTNIDRLRDAWTKVMKLSPILRTSFINIEDPEVDASFAQILYIHPHDFWTEMIVESSPHFPALFEEIRKEAKESAASAPPFRVLCVRTPGQTYLILSIAHALYDGWSLGLIHADVKRAYEDQLEPRPSYEPVLQEILSSSGTDAAEYWADHLFETKPSIFVRRMDAVKSTAVVHRLQHESKVPTNEIHAFTKKCNISLQTIGQTVFAIVLASYVRSLDVTFGSVLSGRDDEMASELLFPTMNTVAVRTILHGSRLELLHNLQDNSLNLKQYQHFPLRKALALANARGRLFESLFIYQGDAERSQQPVSMLYTSIEGRSDVEYPICVEMEVVHGKLVWRCAVKDEILDESGSKEMMNRLEKVLRQIMATPNDPVIHFTSDGASICGLPPFQDEKNLTVDSSGTVSNHDLEQETPPNSQTVVVIREVLAAVSGISEDEITDDMSIFHIGLDSISAIKVSSLLRRRDIVLSVGEMLKAGTISNMARIAGSHSSRTPKQEEDWSTTIDQVLEHLDFGDIRRRAKLESYIQSADVESILPAAAGQLYMLSMWLNTKGSNFYASFVYDVVGSISFDKLQDAWNALVAANSILRTTFVATQDSRIPYVQVLYGVYQNTITKDADPTSNIDQPWAQLFVSETEGGWNVTLKIHHALYDGVSLPLVMQQLQDICNGGTAPRPQDTFAKLVACSFTPSAVEARRSFWTQYLDGLEQRHLVQPDSPPSAKTEIFRPQLLTTRPMEEVARQIGVSIQALFLAAYANLYAELTTTPRNDDVVIGIYLANRSLPISGLENATVPPVNLLPLRVCAPSKNILMDVARQIQQDLQKTGELANATASLWEISEWTGVKIDTFVNFLTLPETNEADGKDGKECIRIVAESHWNEAMSRVTEHTVGYHSDDEQMVHLRETKVNEAYLHAIDIEATMRNGALDVGIFAPVKMLSLEDGNRVMQDLMLALQAIGK